MHKIIGGEFAIDSTLLQDKRESIDLQYSTGRSALYSILMHIGGEHRKILLPEYLCDSITKTVIDAGWEYVFYQLDESLHICVDSKLRNKEFDAILLINYFGVVNVTKDVEIIRKERKEIFIIEDDVQAYYSLFNTSADFAFTSLRKWFSCPDGAQLYVNKQQQIKPCIAMNNTWSQYKLAGNLLKQHSEYIEDALFLSLLDKGEELLEQGYLSPCSDASKQIIANLNFDKIADQRKHNAKILHYELEKIGIRHLYSDDSVPLFIPIFIDERDELRKSFFSKEIFTPVHWPKTNDCLNGDSNLYNQELSLICDQRYGEIDMMRQIDVIKVYMNDRGRS